MTTPGFNPGAVRFRPLPSQTTGNGSANPAQQAQQGAAMGRSRQTAVQPGPQSAKDLLMPILYIAVANALALVALFGVLSIVLSPLGIVAGIQGVRFGVKGVKMMLGKP